VSLLSRNIVITQQDNTTIGRDPWQCSIQISDFVELDIAQGTTKARTANGYMFNTEIRGCGNTDIVQGGITIENIETEGVELNGNAVWLNKAHGIFVINAPGIVIKNNIV